MPPKKRRASLALKPPRPPKPPKPPKAPQAWESYSQSFQVTQYTHDSLSAEVIQPPEALVLIKDDVKEDELGAIFKARGETAKDKADKVDKTKLPELLVKEVIKIGLPAVPTLWEPITAIPKLGLEVINLPDKLIFAARRASKPIGGLNTDVKPNNLSNQNKGSERSAYYTLADQIGIASGGCRSG